MLNCYLLEIEGRFGDKQGKTCWICCILFMVERLEKIANIATKYSSIVKFNNSLTTVKYPLPKPIFARKQT